MKPARGNRETAMRAVESTIEIACPPAEVYAYATDPRHFAEWQHDVVEVQMRGELEFATVRRFGGARRTTTQRITRAEPPHVWSAYGTAGPVRPHATFTIEPIHDGAGSRVTFALAFEGHGIGVALLPLVREQARKIAPHSYETLRGLLEGTE
jgi:uncharacterized protein YndB with AHSA1/START domain